MIECNKVSCHCHEHNRNPMYVIGSFCAESECITPWEYSQEPSRGVYVQLTDNLFPNRS